MTLGIGGYGMGNPMMMDGMSQMGGSSTNMNQYFKAKYGCEDCFKTQPYLQEYPKPIMPLAKESIQKPFWSRVISKLLG